MTPPDANADREFDCPLCGGAFEAPVALLGQEVECPHCSRVVELPTAAEMGLESKAPAATEEPEPAPQQPEPRRKPTRKEREKARRRFNLVLAVVGALILSLAFALLGNLG